MTRTLALRRRERAAWIITITLALCLTAWIGGAIQAQRYVPPKAVGKVLPNFAAQAAKAQTIAVVTRDATYHIARTSKGWAVRDRGDYPVRREILAQFTEGLSNLTLVRAMTRDAAKYPRLGLGDPNDGGEGVLVQVQDARGALIADLILGITPHGLYVRKLNDPQAWAAKGDLPPLKDPAAWLDLSPFRIDTARVARLDLAPASGPPYSAARKSADERFSLQKPADRYPLVAPALLQASAASLSPVNPTDVTTAPAIDGAPRARFVVRTFDGLAIRGELYERGQRHWLKLSAQADLPEAADEAKKINMQAGPWAYGISAVDYLSFAPPLDAVAAVPKPRPQAAPAPMQPGAAPGPVTP